MPPPDPKVLRRALRAMAPARAIVRPHFEGLDLVPDDRPLLFVGNHTLLGVLDVGFLWAELYEKRGIALRGLGDHLHFRVPGWRDLLWAAGAVDGTPDAARELLQAGECVLVFPGGGREVAKRKGEKYKLVWKERMGFARIAIETGATIVPFGAVGVEDALDVVWDADDLYASPLGAILRRLPMRRDIVLPVVKGVGPLPLPRPERLYFRIAEPIPTAALGGTGDPEVVRDVRERTKAAVEDSIARLLDVQAVDPDRNFAARLLAQLRG